MGELVKTKSGARSVPNEVGIDAARRRLAGVYDVVRDALLDRSAQKVSAALSEAEGVDVAGLAREVEEVAVPATKVDIAFHLTKLSSVMHHYNGSFDFEAFLAQLLEDLLDDEVTVIGLSLACRRVRQTCKVYPSIAEVLEAVRAVESDYRSARYRLENLPKRIEEARAFLSGNG